MNRLAPLIILLISVQLSFAGKYLNADTVPKKDSHTIFTSIEQVPEFPGGIQAFGSYLSHNLRYPEVAKLLGINGKLVVSFVVDTGGRIVEAKPMNCIGAGCEAEAVRLLEASPIWKPGTQNSRPVRVIYSVPIVFSFDGVTKTYTQMEKLKKSNYGFVFNINGKLYNIEDAEKILGNPFNPDRIENAEPFFNYNKLKEFDMPDKKEVYLVIIKNAKAS